MASVGPGAGIPRRHLTPDSARRGGVSRVIGVTKPFPRWGWRFWHQNSAIGPLPWRHTVGDREIVLRETESRENPPRSVNVKSRSRSSVHFGQEYRDIGPTGMDVVVVKSGGRVVVEKIRRKSQVRGCSPLFL